MGSIRFHYTRSSDLYVSRARAGRDSNIPFNKCRSSRSIASLHGFDLSRVVALTNRKDLPKAIVFGAEPAFVGWSMELSSQVMKALPILQEPLKRELQ